MYHALKVISVYVYTLFEYILSNHILSLFLYKHDSINPKH